ncbi:hypothetical protein chiPu_0032729, partial [Chiloscyllium punctatum]|nr:hypothetical protein [Chiloscyllium punctatum]
GEIALEGPGEELLLNLGASAETALILDGAHDQASEPMDRSIVLGIEVDVPPAREFGAEHQRRERKIVVVQRALAALQLAFQFAMRADIPDALTRPGDAGIDQVTAIRQGADRHQIEAGPIDQIVAEVIDAIRIAGFLGNPDQPRLDLLEAMIGLGGCRREAQQREREIGPGPGALEIALIIGA